MLQSENNRTLRPISANLPKITPESQSLPQPLKCPRSSGTAKLATSLRDRGAENRTAGVKKCQSTWVY